jgi:thiamine-monophosphate kinase
MRLADLGEWGLIRRIERIAGLPGGSVVLGIGDDAALLRPRPSEDLAVTTDAAVEGVHFRFDQETPRSAGRRAAVANLSDLAAMGARPLGLTLALAAPPSAPAKPVLELIRGMVAEARQHGCPLVGGNVTRARQLSLTITALGAVRRGAALRRDAARSGDRILVTGRLGQSALERARGRVRRVPRPRLAAGRVLGRQRHSGACIDISDGLFADLGHLCHASGVAAAIDLERLPRARGFAAACRAAGCVPERLLLAGGEDYELLFTARQAGGAERAWQRRLGLPVREIGRIRAGRGVSVAGLPAGVDPAGWRHF